MDNKKDHSLSPVIRPDTKLSLNYRFGRNDKSKSTDKGNERHIFMSKSPKEIIILQKDLELPV